ncbi:uncharacterized protein CC84DRAFT_129933 [Paraphaeosphaeria sporulosa]|uniref:Uncharacterized protein n=1 Tax=Paraphaeosphaeria sporulosa TaxID=1460663 RepID=A0A177D048_9PLEO|nr:uncharacterized protein CC84DRAFT_129933 [Paraphaeosphaeria sporulosa]OAG12607.1 hypothetical protein CC84DRAFT_129933 [Paraphaeosphaeria sporulosa]
MMNLHNSTTSFEHVWSQPRRPPRHCGRRDILCCRHHSARIRTPPAVGLRSQSRCVGIESCMLYKIEEISSACSRANSIHHCLHKTTLSPPVPGTLIQNATQAPQQQQQRQQRQPRQVYNTKMGCPPPQDPQSKRHHEQRVLSSAKRPTLRTTPFHLLLISRLHRPKPRRRLVRREVLLTFPRLRLRRRKRAQKKTMWGRM